MRATKATKETKATRETRSTKGGAVSKAKAKTSTPRKEPSVEPEDMTVVQLRAALKKRGLPFNGLKADLVERLTSAPDKAEMTEDTDMQDSARVEPKSEAAAPSPSVGAAAAAAPGPSPATATPHATLVEEEGGAVRAAEVDGAAVDETGAAAGAPGPSVTTPASQVFSPRLPGYEVPPFPAAATAAAAPVAEEAVEAAAAAAAPSIVPLGATEIRDVPPESDAPELPLSMLDTAAHLGLPIAGGRAAAAADEEDESIDVHRVVTDPDSPRGTGGPTGEAAQVPATGEEEALMAESAKGGREAPSGGADDEALVPEQ